MIILYVYIYTLSQEFSTRFSHLTKLKIIIIDYFFFLRPLRDGYYLLALLAL